VHAHTGGVRATAVGAWAASRGPAAMVPTGDEDVTMKSQTKYAPSAETLRSLLERAYGSDAVPAGDVVAHALDEGHCNAVYSAGLRDGRRVVLKIGASPHAGLMSHEHALIRTEVAAIRLLRERTALPVPVVDHFDGSRGLVDAEWFAMPYIDGDNFGHLLRDDVLPADDAARLHAQLGAMTREVNSIVGPAFGGVLDPRFDTWREAFTDLVGNALADAEQAGVDLGVHPDVIRRAVTDHAADLDEVRVPRLIEWDLWPTNAIVADGTIIGIIDHERALYGDPIMEAGFAPVDLPGVGGFDDFVRGYGRGELTRSERRRRLLYTVNLFLILVAEVPYRQYEDTSLAEHARDSLPMLLDRLADLA